MRSEERFRVLIVKDRNILLTDFLFKEQRRGEEKQFISDGILRVIYFRISAVDEFVYAVSQLVINTNYIFKDKIESVFQARRRSDGEYQEHEEKVRK